VTASTITIGDIATVTGPVPGLFQGANDGMDAWAAYVNAAGGIAGHQVKVEHLDDALDCATFKNDLKQLATSVFAAVGTYSTEDSCGKAVLEAYPNFPYIPATVLSTDLDAASIHNVFTPIVEAGGDTTAYFNYVKSQFPNDITHAAELATGNPTPLTKAAQSVGYKFVYQRVLGPTDTSYVSDILRMKAAGVKIVDIRYSAVNTAVTFLQEAAQQNFHPDAVISVAAYDNNFLKLLGNPSLASNLYAPSFSALYLGTDRAANPAVNTFDTWMAKAKPNVQITLFSENAWTAGQLFLQAMHNAGSQITQTSLLHALSGIQSFDADGLNSKVNPGSKTDGNVCVVMAGVRNGQWARLDPSSGFDCNGSWVEAPNNGGLL
jgi:ABC-type branched-subunit amino acid transport system substrate-binding protein